MRKTRRKIRILVRRRRDMQKLEKEKEYRAMGNNLIFLNELVGIIKIDFFHGRRSKVFRTLAAAIYGTLGQAT